MNKPNILYVFTDQQRWDTSGLHGNPLDLMPNFDRMAQLGTHLANTFTPQPVCGPARSCVQTGMYATQTGCFRNGIPLPADATTIAHHLGGAGYETAYIGKWHLADNSLWGAVPPEQRGGYDYWLAANMLEFTSDSYQTTVYNNDGEAVSLPGYRVDALTDAAIRYMATPREKPFFLFLSFLEPHHQNHLDDYPPPDGYRERYTGRWTPPDLAALGGSAPQHLGGYYGMVKRLDEALGRMLDALKSLGLLDNTVVVYTADHGCHFKTRNDEYKRSGHDSSIHVPAAIHGPGFQGGGRVQKLVSLLDISATLLDIGGVAIPAEMAGQSIRALLQREAPDWPDDVFIQISEAEVGRAVRTQRWKYGVTAPQQDGLLDADADHYVEAYLYDLAVDPYELTNLIGSEAHAAVTARMKERLLSRMAAAGERLPKIEAAPGWSNWQRKVADHEVNQ
ncbi:MAG: sulfatase-like hydrolase/transferase [Anaerolineales bacterium]|nr:sulfatase-like hydrolase/transferase [Anaerolineales bacterium]